MIGKDGMIKNKTRTSNSTPLRWSKFETTFVLTSHSTGVQRIAEK